MPFLIGWTCGGIVLAVMALGRGDNASVRMEGYKILFGFVAFGIYKLYKYWRSR